MTTKQKTPRLVVIESPFAGNVGRNLRYVRAAMKDSFARGEAPFPSHALYTQPGVLDDELASERELGMAAGFAWGGWAELVAVYTDLGISPGMSKGIELAHSRGQVVEERRLGEGWDGAAAPSSEAFDLLRQEVLSARVALLVAERERSEARGKGLELVTFDSTCAAVLVRLSAAEKAFRKALELTGILPQR